MKYALYLLYVAFFVRSARLRSLYARLSRGQRRGVLALFGLVVIGQAAGLKYQSYPFVKWGMYSGFSPGTQFFEYRGVRPDGGEADFPVARLLRIHQPLCPTCGKRLTWRLKDLGNERYAAPPGPEREALAARYDELLRAAWRQHQRRHPDVELEAVDVWRARYDASQYVDASSIDRELVWRVSLR